MEHLYAQDRTHDGLTDQEELQDVLWQEAQKSKHQDYPKLCKLQTVRFLLEILSHSSHIFSLETLLHSQPIPPLQFVWVFLSKDVSHFLAKSALSTAFQTFTNHLLLSVHMCVYIYFSTFLCHTWCLTGILYLEASIYITVPTKTKAW